METNSENQIASLVERARAGDKAALTELARLHQGMAFSTACLMLKDFDLAKDAVQEAFIAAYYSLPTLRDPESFGGWLRRIVVRCCCRNLRKRRPTAGSYEVRDTVPCGRPLQDRVVVQKEQDRTLLLAVEALPEEQRSVVILHYLEDLSHREVARRLGVSHYTVNNRLHQARQKLRERMSDMVEDSFARGRLPKEFADELAEIIRVEGMMVEARAGSSQAPGVFDQWYVPEKDSEQPTTLTLVQRLPDGRMILSTADDTPPIAPGTKIEQTGEIGRAVRKPEQLLSTLLSQRASAESEFLETGIKVIDLMVPFCKSGSVALLGAKGLGKAVLVKELHHRLGVEGEPLKLAFLASPEEAMSLRLLLEREPDFPPDAGASIETSWIVSPSATDPRFTDSVECLDASVFFSPLAACRGLYPSVDPVRSRTSRVPSEGIEEKRRDVALKVSELLNAVRKIEYDREYCELVAVGAHERARTHAHETRDSRLRDLSEDKTVQVLRARRIEAFFSQSFFVAEPFTGASGSFVPLEKTIEGCTAIIDGTVDDLPLEAFAYSGDLEDVVQKSASM